MAALMCIRNKSFLWTSSRNDFENERSNLEFQMPRRADALVWMNGVTATGRREPDLATMFRIAEALGTSPNWLLGVSSDSDIDAERAALLERLHNSASCLPDAQVRLLCVFAEAIVREEDDQRKST